jgi:ADP-ribose pyrophosphatase YjhB (NUDIX family)
MVVGCIPEYQDKILLCRRAIEPRLGYWTIPAGFLENRETVAQGARREAWEETGSEMEILDLVTVVTLLPYHQVYMIFRARLLDQNFGPTEESSEVRLFSESEIPWPELAFETVQKSLELYFQDRAKGAYTLHMTSIGQ